MMATSGNRWKTVADMLKGAARCGYGQSPKRITRRSREGGAAAGHAKGLAAFHHGGLVQVGFTEEQFREAGLLSEKA
jgi:hypothetical protein